MCGYYLVYALGCFACASVLQQAHVDACVAVVAHWIQEHNGCLTVLVTLPEETTVGGSFHASVDPVRPSINGRPQSLDHPWHNYTSRFAVCVHPGRHRLFPAPKRMTHEVQLREALADCRGDLELRFQGGQSIRVHSQKMALASSVFQALMDDVMGDQIAPESAKRRRIAGEGEGAEPKLPSLLVGLMGSGSRLNSNLDFQVAAEGRV